MQKPTFRIILIDPAERAVLSIESTGTLEHVQQIVQTDYVEPLGLNSEGDVMLFAEEPKPGVLPFKIGPQIIRGRAVIVGRGDEEFAAPTVGIDAIRAQVSFPPACFTPK